MRTALLWLGVLAACFSWAPVARACSCKPPPVEDLPTTLRTARDKARFIYRARVLTGSARDVRVRTSVEVLEVFKGPLKPGARLEGSHDPGPCTMSLPPGKEYLVYVNAETPSRFESCTRTRALSGEDRELTWLRTGRPPAMPVALQREAWTCGPITPDKGPTPCGATERGENGVTAPEVLPAGTCSWDEPDKPTCELRTRPSPLAKDATRGPVVICPAPTASGVGYVSCRVAAVPLPVSPQKSGRGPASPRPAPPAR